MRTFYDLSRLGAGIACSYQCDFLAWRGGGVGIWDLRMCTSISYPCELSIQVLGLYFLGRPV